MTTVKVALNKAYADFINPKAESPPEAITPLTSVKPLKNMIMNHFNIQEEF